MKSLFIIRHAKSSWGQPSLDDFDRPLNERGKKDAAEMAKRLEEKKINIELFVSSPAKRARKTAGQFMEAFNRDKDEILLIPGLYHASPDTFTNVISGLEDKYSSVALFSHNPGITAFINTLTYVRLDNMPTCGIFGISLDAGHWKEFPTAKKDFLFFDFPKSGAE
jgi:phosphohistidine phosphatase